MTVPARSFTKSAIMFGDSFDSFRQLWSIDEHDKPTGIEMHVSGSHDSESEPVVSFQFGEQEYDTFTEALAAYDKTSI